MAQKSLLKPDEEQELKRKIGNMCSSLTCTVAKLYLASPNGDGWRETGVWGAIALIVDRSHEAKPKYIVIYDMMSWEKKFAEEIYEMMQYDSPTPTFHTFETRSAIVGLSFCNANEAQQFFSKVRAMIPVPKDERAAFSRSQDERKGFFGTLFGRKKQQSSVQIGAPTNFQHKQHIGYDPSKGFECSEIPEQWKAMFKNAGIKKKDLQNPEIAAQIYDALQEINTQQDGDVPAAPPLDVPAAPPLDVPDAPPAPDAPEAPDAPAMPYDSGEEGGGGGSSLAAQLAGGAGKLKKAAPRPGGGSSGGGGGDARGNLLESIKQGAKLKAVSQQPRNNEANLPEINANNEEDIMHKLMGRMKQIRSATQEDDDDNHDDDDWDVK